MLSLPRQLATAVLVAAAMAAGRALASAADDPNSAQPVLALSAESPVTAPAAVQQAPAGGDQAPKDEKRTPPRIQAIRVDTPPTIDGKLDDECWKGAARLEGFFPPDVAEPNPEETIGFICVDDTAIYVAYVCRDRTPGDISALETRRNGSLGDDDLVEFSLDPYNQHRDSYSFRVNARGTQGEEIPGGSATKIEWRGDWKAATCRTEDGWTAEMAIPFSILRYPPGQTTFGFFLFRHFAKERLWVVHPITGGKSFDINLSGDLVDLHPPPYKPRPIYMPYATLDLGDAVGKRYDAGLDVQYRMANGLTAIATLNPDFKQIEDVVEPISFSYTERHLPELRPFFVTGQGFLPGSILLYTRRIEDFDAGVKFFGTSGKESIGILNATRFGGENAFVGQWRHLFSADLDTTVRVASDRRAGEPDNLIYGFDAMRRWRCSDGEDGLGFMYRNSQTTGVDYGAIYESFGYHFRGSGEPNWEWNLRLVTPDFNPRLGYYYDQNSVGGSLRYGKWTHYGSGPVEFWGWDVGPQYFPRLEGDGVLSSQVWSSLWGNFRNGRSANLAFTVGRERGFDSSGANFHYGWNRAQMYRRGGFTILKGKRAGGDYTYYTFNQASRPMKNVTLTLNTEYSRLQPPSTDAGHSYQTVLTASYDLTAEKCISLRAIQRDAGVSLFAGYRQVVRRGMDAYLLVGDPNPGKTGFTQRFALKLIWAI